MPAKKKPAKKPRPANRDEQGRFKPGTSGNPKGRPKGVSLASMIAEVLTEDSAKKIIGAIIAEAKGGNVKAFQALIERTDGKVPQAVTGGQDEDGNERPIPLRIID